MNGKQRSDHFSIRFNNHGEDFDDEDLLDCWKFRKQKKIEQSPTAEAHSKPEDDMGV